MVGLGEFETFGEWLAAAMQSRAGLSTKGGMSPAELGQQTGISRTSIISYRDKGARPRGDHIWTLLHYFGVPVPVSEVSPAEQMLASILAELRAVGERVDRLREFEERSWIAFAANDDALRTLLEKYRGEGVEFGGEADVEPRHAAQEYGGARKRRAR